MTHPTAPGAAPIGKTRGPWAVWFLSLLTGGIYYLVWYVKLNKEIAAAGGADEEPGTFGLWFSQVIPFVNWVGLAHTADRLATAQRRAGMEPTVSGGMTILSSLWSVSQTRYLQRRANALWEAMAAQQLATGIHSAASAVGAAPYAAPAAPLSEPAVAMEA